MKQRTLCKLLALFMGVLLLWGCDLQDPATVPAEPGTSSPAAEATAPAELYQYGYIAATADKVYEFTDNRPVFSLENTYYTKPILVELKTQQEAQIYYTINGADPDQTATLYEDGIYITPRESDFPTALTIKARAYYADGTESGVAMRTYFCAHKVDQRFSTMVVFITGDPNDLTKGPDGIFYGDNYHKRGDETERPVFIEAVDENGRRLFAQYAGIRIYGGASRANSIKSMKLYARKRYDPLCGKFHTDLFGTMAEDGTVVSEYDKLVLRNCGNDFQFGFIRDELCQTLAMQAGYSDYEAVVPAVAYLNGQYYGYFWLHESYCDDYFKNKYPNPDALGEFIIAEGNEKSKSEEEDGGDEIYAAEYNELYERFSQADLRDEGVYAQLCQQIDIENYLDYFAFNIYINNWDWPQNNYKCYRYVPAEGEAVGTGVYDGRWRYLLHDTDFSFHIYQNDDTAADYNNIAQILNPESDRYAPLFAALIRRADCREYFLNKIILLSETALSGENVTATLFQMHTQRCTEQDYFYQYMNILRKKGDNSFWSSSYTLWENMDAIRAFANERGEHILAYTRRAFAKYD